jgi:hypothetical protein
MTSLILERFDLPRSIRDARALGAAGERVGDVLAGRTVWCAACGAADRASAQALREKIDGAGPGVQATSLPLPRPEELPRRSAGGGELLVDYSVGPGDVVIAHDQLSAIFAGAARERGAHAVWRLHMAPGIPVPGRVALELLGRLPQGIDAYLLSWIERGARGRLVERVAAAMPGAGIVAAKEFPSRPARGGSRRLAWRMAVAEVVRSDRDEAVGGTLHARPSVAAR